MAKSELRIKETDEGGSLAATYVSSDSEASTSRIDIIVSNQLNAFGLIHH